MSIGVVSGTAGKKVTLLRVGLLLTVHILLTVSHTFYLKVCPIRASLLEDMMVHVVAASCG